MAEVEKTDAVKEEVKEETKTEDAAKDEQKSEAAVKEEIKKEDAVPDPMLDAKILRQMEHYFGNSNLMRDKFLKEQIKEDDGWVPIATMLKFNRLKQYSEDQAVIVNALKNSELLEINEAGDKLRRNVDNPLPEDTKEYREELSSRTVYAKGFKLDSSLDDLLTYFETYGKTENVFMRRDFYKNIFKGSVFTTFKTKDDAQKFVDEEDTKYEGQPLEVKLFKEDYFKKKQDERKVKKPPKEKKENGDGENDKEDEENGDGTTEGDEERAKRQMTQNAILHFKGINPETSVGDMKTFFGEYGDVGYVDYEKGQTEGYLRMKEPNSAEPTLAKLKEANDGKIVINESELEMRVVEGDEELQYWTKMMRDIYNKFKKGGNRGYGRGGRGGRGRGRGGRGGGRGRGGFRGGKRRNRDGDGGGAPAKVAKTE